VCEFPTRENAGDFSVDSAVMVCIQSSWAPRFRMCCILRFWRAQGRFTRASCVFAGCVPRHKIHNCMMKRAQVVEGRRLRLRNHMRCRSQLCGSVESLLRFRRCSQCANLRPAKTQAISPSTARSGCVSNHLGHRVFTCVASCVFAGPRKVYKSILRFRWLRPQAQNSQLLEEETAGCRRAPRGAAELHALPQPALRGSRISPAISHAI
jgi:hypothetical protein